MGIDLRFHGAERPSAPKPRKSISFLEKLNVKHPNLSRSKRSDDGLEHHRGHSRTPSLPDEVMIAPSETVTSRAERTLSEMAAKYYGGVEEEKATIDTRLSTTRARQDSGVSLPLQNVITPNGSAESLDFAHDAQSFRLRQQPSLDSSLVTLARVSLAGSRKSSSRGGALSEMSDEQMDEWLERPVDAEVHRYRKLSAGSPNLSMGSTEWE
ncbi:hypothetical protein N0V83_004501 [Neocucurbitaria cava]|uniref:Uncharacterized protein n=1 Tax=Neocucurbitaria cava TaxID=798079 RepID=A0A9W8Y9V5_9PLEO|nr:hypothetical protein N0V83_004501 [Neocucurbitaria cava]